MFVYPKIHMLKNLMAKVIVLGGGAVGRQLDHEGRTLTNGISALIKEAPEG